MLDLDAIGCFHHHKIIYSPPHPRQWIEGVLQELSKLHVMLLYVEAEDDSFMPVGFRLTKYPDAKV